MNIIFKKKHISYALYLMNFVPLCASNEAIVFA